MKRGKYFSFQAHDLVLLTPIVLNYHRYFVFVAFCAFGSPVLVIPSGYEREDHVPKLLYLAARPSLALRILHVFIFFLPDQPTHLHERRAMGNETFYWDGLSIMLHLENKTWHWKQCFPFGKLGGIGETCTRHELVFWKNASSSCWRLLKMTGLSTVPGSRITLTETFRLWRRATYLPVNRSLRRFRSRLASTHWLSWS